MSAQLEILPEVKYRIQSIDYGTFLERRDESVILRQLKKDNKNQEASPPNTILTLARSIIHQQWTFIKRENTSSSVYEIRNLDDSDSWSLTACKAGSVTNDNIGTVTDPILAVDSNDAAEKYWRFILKSPGTSWDFYMMSEATSKLFAHVTLSTAPALQLQPISSIKPGAIMRALEINERFKNAHRYQFVIVSKGNGKCTIYSVKEKKYLNVTKNPNNSDQWLPTLETEEHVWNIRQLNNITWSICVDLEISKNQYGISTSITFSLTVKNSTFAHNQLWLIEPADAPGTDIYNVSSSLYDASYVIHNRAASAYWNAGGNPIKNIWCWPTTLETAKAAPNGTWNVTHDEYNHVRLQSPYAPNSWAAYGMTGSQSPVSWRLIPVSAHSQWYYITTDMTSLKPSVATNVNTGSAGAFTELVEGNESQMWEFIRI
ncbi:hypothetical protein HWV62_32126 [Athelia sp. TMB]|nr:hypothetical protein HWV62_32126 [Athelia sp. TMB]